MDKKNRDIFISYIVPCYNMQNYLPKCLESLAKQKISEGAGIEYILVNDGSKDGTLSLLKEFAAKDDRAIVIDQENQGVCAARNHGLKYATGKYVYFHDGDDILTDEASQLVYNESQKNTPDIIIPYAYSVKEDELDKKFNWNTFGEKYVGHYTTREFVDKINRLPVSVKVYKRTTLVNNNIVFDEDLRVGEVYTFFFHALAYSQFVNLTNGRMMNWVLRTGGTTFGYNIDRDREIIRTMHRIDDYAGIFTFDIRSKVSYQSSLYEIVSVFCIGKYKKEKYTPEIGLFFKDVIKDKQFKQTLVYFVYKKKHSKRRFLESLVLLYLPVRYAHVSLKGISTLIVLKKKLKSISSF